MPSPESLQKNHLVVKLQINYEPYAIERKNTDLWYRLLTLLRKKKELVLIESNGQFPLYLDQVCVLNKFNVQKHYKDGYISYIIECPNFRTKIRIYKGYQKFNYAFEQIRIFESIPSRQDDFVYIRFGHTLQFEKYNLTTLMKLNEKAIIEQNLYDKFIQLLERPILNVDYINPISSNSEMKSQEDLSLEQELEILKEFPMPIPQCHIISPHIDGYVIQNNHIIVLGIHGYSNFHTIPVSIGKLTHLVELDLSVNGLESVPSQIGNLKELRELRLSKNNIKDLPFSLTTLPILKKVLIEDNPLTPQAVEILINLKQQGCSIQALNLPDEGLFIDL